MVGYFFLFIVAGTTIWVLIDSINIGAKRDRTLGMAGTSPAAWFFGCIILWIVFFPLYLYQRDKIKAAAMTRAGVGSVLLASPSPPPGWYPDPSTPGAHRWWDGSTWGDPPPPPRVSASP